MLDRGYYVRLAFIKILCGHMSDRAETCKNKAGECHRCAVAAHDIAVRKMYLDLARQWRELGEQAELLAAMQTRTSHS
jgi:hypothetical protein